MAATNQVGQQKGDGIATRPPIKKRMKATKTQAEPPDRDRTRRDGGLGLVGAGAWALLSSAGRR